ncbi:MAG: CRISPR-associated endoribonuclease Cas6 [Cyclonatronaceae bacterium]
MGWLSGRNVQQNPSSPRQRREGALFFRGGARWDIGMYDDERARALISRLAAERLDFYGMHIHKTELLNPPLDEFESESHRFLANSPVLLRRPAANGNYTHVTFRSPGSGKLLSDGIREKAEMAGLSAGESLNVFFDPNFENAKTRLIDIQGYKMKASVCPVIAYGTPEMLEFIWTLGAGELCALGFGGLDHTGR